MAAPRKKPAAEVEAEAATTQPQPEVRYIREEPEPRGVNWVGILGLLALAMVLMAGCTGVVGWIGLEVYDRVSERDGGSRPDNPGGDVNLVRAIETAGVTPEHAVYFAKVSQGMADMIAADAAHETPVFDQRTQVIEAVGDAGKLSATGNEAGRYSQLPAVMEMAFAGVWETNEQGELMGGAFTAADRAAVVSRWQNLAAALKEVAE